MSVEVISKTIFPLTNNLFSLIVQRNDIVQVRKVESSVFPYSEVSENIDQKFTSKLIFLQNVKQLNL